jgi:hypothetical protein
MCDTLRPSTYAIDDATGREDSRSCVDKLDRSSPKTSQYLSFDLLQATSGMA